MVWKPYSTRLFAFRRSLLHEISRLTGFGVVGGNVGPWRLRSHFQYNNRGHNPNQKSSYWYNRQGWRDIRSLYSRLSIGELSQNSQIFDSFDLIGVSLNSDERMIPPSLRGYAPRIEGIARTNAKVTVSHQGRLLYSTTVPPGPFSLQDLNTSVQGQLDISVEEADGSTQTFTVYTASVPYLTRKGGLQYKTAVGKIPFAAPTAQLGMVASGEASWGMTDTLSLYGGMIGSPRYQAYALGGAKDLGVVGALSSDVTHAHAVLTNGIASTGRSYRVNYAKRFNAYDLGLNIAGYRFSDRRFWSFNDFIHQYAAPAQRYPWRREKQRLNVSLTKRFGPLSASLLADKIDYWNSGSGRSMSLSLSRTMPLGPLKNTSVTLSLQQTQTRQDTQRQVFLGISIPLEKSRYIAYTTQADTAGKLGHSVSLSDASHERHAYNVGASYPSHHRPSFYGNYHYEGNAFVSDIGLTQEVAGYRALNANVSSSLLLHSSGLTANKGSYGRTRVLVDTQGSADIPLSNNRTATNASGHAVLENVSVYTKQSVSVKTTELPDNVDVKNPIQSVVLTDGAVGLARFHVAVGQRLLATLAHPNGKPLPLGTVIQDAHTKQEAGMVGEDGLTYLTGINKNSALVAELGEQRCQITDLPTETHLDDTTLALVCHPTTP